jgi:CBS domain-containing protein
MTLRVEQIMTPPVGWIEGWETVTVAARRLLALGVSSLPVRGRGCRFLGLLSDRLIVERCAAEGLDPTKVPVGAIMWGDIHEVIDPERPVDDMLLTLMFQHGIDGLPVVEGEQFVGMIGIVDVASQIVESA